MGVHFMFYFSLLLWQMQAAASEEPDEFGCMEECGGVKIPFSFGIEPGCYNNSWFKVTCKETNNGQKPFISLINMEILNSSEILDSLAADSVYVNNPVTYVNCGNKDNNGAAVNLNDRPFFFSRRLNMFQSLGCGNLATLSANIKTGPIANCLQPNCGDLSSDAGCSASIPENLTSYTVNMTAIKAGKKCTSAFVSARYIAVGLDYDINNEATHVPAILEWNPVYCDLEDHHSLSL